MASLTVSSTYCACRGSSGGAGAGGRSQDGSEERAGVEVLDGRVKIGVEVLLSGCGKAGSGAFEVGLEVGLVLVLSWLVAVQQAQISSPCWGVLKAPVRRPQYNLLCGERST